MDFAKKHLEKYGWSEGDGLGKSRDGMVTAIKPKLKFDSAGLGHTRTDEFAFHWWDHVYNSAASNIQVTPTEDGTVVIQKEGENLNVSNKKPVKNLRPKSSSYGNFCKAGLLKTNGDIEKEEEEPAQEVEIVERKDFMVTLTDEEILKACGGRTAHKGARHGHRCTGKLNRVAEQEAALLKQWQSQEATKVQSMGSRSKKVKRDNSSVLPTPQDVQESLVAEESEEQPPKKKKKKQKRREEESASETVEEPVTLVETSPANTKKKKKKKKKDKAMYTEENLE